VATSKVNVKVDDRDFDQLQKNLNNNVLPGFDEAMKRGLMKGAGIIVDLTKADISSTAKHQTGQLESAVGAKVFSSKPGYINIDAGYINTDAAIWGTRVDRYFVYWEIGSSQQKPRHSALKAKNKAKKEINEAAVAELMPYLRK
jgi:hypothetical protein